MSAIYLKKVIAGQFIMNAAKITSEGSLEVYGGGSMETLQECPEVSMMNFMSKGFIDATKEEYDEVHKRAVREINGINAIM